MKRVDKKALEDWAAALHEDATDAGVSSEIYRNIHDLIGKFDLNVDRVFREPPNKDINTGD